MLDKSQFINITSNKKWNYLVSKFKIYDFTILNQFIFFMKKKIG